MLERVPLIPAPDQSIYQPAPPTPTNAPDVLGMFGQQDAVLPSDTDQWADFYAAGHTPSSAQASMQPERFNWKSSGADRYVNADRYLQEGFDPFAGSVQVGDKFFDFNEERYDKLQTWGDALKKGGGQFLALTSSTFIDSLKGEARLANALFNFGTGYIDNFKERLIGTPEELALQDEQQKAIFDKYAIFHGSSAETSVINKQFAGDLIGQSGFAIGPTAEFLLSSLVTAGISSGFSMVTKGSKLVNGSKVANLMAESSKIAKVADQINDARKVTDITKNAKLMDQIMGSLKQGYKWSAKQLNPITGAEDIYKAVQAGATPVQLGITTVGALKNSLSQANMAFNEARFEAAGTFGQIYGELLTKFEKDNGRTPNAQELEKIEQLAYDGATDNFIVNSGVLMTMNSLQFGALFSKFSSTSKFLREAMETGADAFTVSGKIEGKAAKRIYGSGKFGAFGKFNTIRKDFGIGTALYTVGKKAATGTAAKFEILEGLQEILQTGSGDALKDYYVNMYDGTTDMDGNHIFDADYMSAIKAQYNKEGWRTFLMGAMTGYLISPLQASVMYTAKKGYGRINDSYRKEANAYEKAVADAIELQNSFYKNPATALNDAIKNFKVVSKVGESMIEAIQEGDKYTYHNAKDDALASTVAAALKTNTLPSLLDSIQEMSQWTDQEIVDAFPTILTPGEDIGSVKEYINSIATDIKQYNKNWDKLKEDYGHLVMPELYKANQAEYTQALYAKRALDEAIELLATTDYKATKAIQRAVDIKNKMAAIPGLGTSISHGFNILSSRQQTAVEISNLTQMIAAAEGLPLDEESSKLTNSHKEQLAALVIWDTMYSKWETAKDSLSDGEFNKLTDAYESFIEAHNKQGGISNNVINKTALREAFPNLGQYIALNRDAEKYTEALNVLANPRDFTRLYGKIMTDIQAAATELNKKANKEAEETIKEEFAPTPEATETQTPEEIDIQLFAERIARGEDMSSPEDVQFYDNNKEAIEDILVTIQDGGIEARITRIATEMLNSPTPQQKDQKFVVQYSKRIAAKLKELKAAGTTVAEEETGDDADSNTTDSEADEELKEREEEARIQIAEKLQQIEDRKRQLIRQQQIEKTILDQPKLIDIPAFDKIKYKGEIGYLEYDAETNTMHFNADSGKSTLVDKIDGGYEQAAYEYGVFLTEDNVTNAIEVGEDSNGNFTLSLYGTKYVNLYSDPLKAINYDKDGNIISVNLSTDDGKNTSRTFKGENNRLANVIAYQIILYTYEKEARSKSAREYSTTDEREDSTRKEQDTTEGNRKEQRKEEERVRKTTKTVQEIQKDEEEVLLLNILLNAETIEEIDELKKMLTPDALKEYADIIELATDKINTRIERERKEEERKETERKQKEEEKARIEKIKDAHKRLKNLQTSWVKDVDDVKKKYPHTAQNSLSPEGVAERDMRIKEINTRYTDLIAGIKKEIAILEGVKEEEPVPDEKPETDIEQPIGNTENLSKVSKVYDYSFIVPKDKAAFDKIVGALTPEQLKEGTTVVIKRNVPIGTADSKPIELKMANFDANPHVLVRQLQGSNKIYREEYSIEVQYNGQTLGFMSDPYINTFVFNGQVVPVSQLSEEQFKVVFKLQKDRNLTTTLTQFKQMYADGVAVRNAIIAMSNPDGTPTIISSDRLPIEFNISSGELDYIPEKEADRRDTLKAEMQNRGIELPTDENPLVRVGVIDTLDKKDILTRGTELVEYTKDYNEQLGRYIAVFVGKGGNKTTRALKSPVVQDTDLSERITNSNNNRSKIVEAIAANTVLSPTEIKRANELNNLFITTSPNTGIYFYIGIDKMGKYTITGVSGSKDNKKTAVHSFDTAMPTDAEEFRAFLTEEARKLGAKLGVNLDAVTITRNNVREGIRPDATVEEILNMQVVAGTKNRIVTYKPAVAQNTIQQGFPNVPEKASTTAPIEGGSKVAVDLGTVQPTPVEESVIATIEHQIAVVEIKREEELKELENIRNKNIESIEKDSQGYPNTIPINSQGIPVDKTSIKENAIKTEHEFYEFAVNRVNEKYNAQVVALMESLANAVDTSVIKKAVTPKKTVNKLKDKAAKKSKGLDNTTGKALKVISENQAPQYIENIAKFKQWVQENLPDTISVEEVDSLAADLVTNNITAGEFLTYILDSGKIGGKIRTTKDGQFKYHEAFHAVFRLLLPQQQIDRLLYLASQESPVTADKLAAMRKLHSDYRAMDNAELTERYYEEYLADKFDSWKSNRAVKTHHGIKAFFAKLWDIIQKIAARITRNDIKKLFYQIDEGSFRYTQVQPNQFTGDTAFIDSTASVKKVILVGTKEIQTPDGVIEVNKYLPQEEGDILATSIAAMFFKSIQTEGQYNTNQLLDQIIGMYAELYNFEGPDGELKENYEVMLENADPVTREYLEDKLSDYYNLFTHPKAIRSLKEAVMVHLKINGIKQTLEDDEYETIGEEVGERNTENFDRDAGTIGGYKSLAKGLRMYIAGTTIPFKDTFGNEWLVAPKEGVPGIPLEQAVNANFVYNGMLKALSNSSDIRILMSRLYTYYNNSGNQATTAFIQRVMNDTGLQIQPNGEFTVDNTKNSILLQQVIKAFNQYEEDHLHITIQKDEVGNWLYTTSVANKTKATENQLNQWSAAYDRLFVVGAKQLQSKADKDKAITTINNALAKIEQHIDTSELRSKEINQSVLTRVSREVSNVLKTTLGINLHPSFIAYSILVNKAPEARTEEQQLFVEAFNTDSASNNTNAYITPESIAAIRKAIKGEGSIFSDQGMREVLKGLATGNSYFDETINTISYTNADNKVVYSHKLPSFYNRSIYDLNKKAVLAKYRRDSSRAGSYLLNDEEFKYLSDKKMLRSDSTDGIRVVDGDNGLTYGKFGDRERLAYLFGFYTGAKKIKRKEGDFYVSPHMVRIVEAKNSAPIVYLPVIPSVMLGQLTTNALDKMTLGIQAEVDRIKEFKKELKAIKAGKMKPIEGYHTGKRYDKEGSWELPTPNENVSNWKTKPRGFFLFDGAQMVDPLKAELEAGNLDIEKLHDQLNEYWIAETKRTIDMMVDLGFIKYDAGTGKYTNRLAPDYLFIGMPTQGGRAESLNINPNDFFHNVMQVVVDDYINTKAINTLLMGNEAAAFKDGVDQIKRASGAAAAYIPMNVDVINPDWGIDAPLVYTQHVTYKSNNFKKMSDAPGKATGDKDDAQMYMTEKGLRYLLFGLGKLNQTQVDVLSKLSNGESLTAEEFYGAGGLKEKGAFNSYKLVHFDGQVYLKSSTLPLFRQWVSILDSNGDWIANPETEELHELLNKMEEQEALMEADGKNIVVFAHPTTASKSVKRGVVDNISAITSESFEELPAAYTGLQLENPSNKTTITDPTQAKQQIMAEQDDNSDVIFMGKTMKAGDVKRLYMTSTAQRKINNYNSAVNDIFSFEDGMIELGKALEIGRVTPKLGNFYKRAIETLVASGTDSHTLGFFQLDENGEPIYNNNFPAILPKFTELFLSYFSKGILSEKVPGTSVALVSPFGAKKFKQVTSIWQPTDKGYLPEYEGQPKTWRVITTNEVVADPEYYRRVAKRWTGDLMERRFFDVQPGDIILDDLRHNYPKYNEKGEYLGRFSEFVMPAHYKEVMDGIPESLRYNFGIRIPSDDKHSYIALEYVDVLPVQYGSIGIFPQELIEISGADFDIDKLYMEFMDTYVNDGKRVAYGTAVSLEDQFEEYLIWQKENNKVVKAKFEEVAETKEGLIATLLGDDRRILTATLQELGMPYDIETFEVKGTRNNNGVLTNEILGAKLAMLNNDKIAEDTIDKRAIINQPTSVDMLASMVTDLRNKFTEILNNPDIVEEDKRGIQTILGILSDPVADINTIRGKVLTGSANKEGSRNIGAAVNSMLTFSVLSQGKVQLTTPISFSGQIFTGFDGDTTIDGVRKFAQISSEVNAMTDNAKERIAAKLGLNIEAVGYVSAMIAIGIPMESGVLLMLQPVVREYFKKLQNLKGSLKTAEEARTSRASVLKVMLEEYKMKTADALGISQDKVKKVELTNDRLTKNIANNGRFVENQYSALLFMSEIAEISSRMIEVANVTKLSKGLPTEFSLVDNIIEAIQNLQEDPSKPPAVFEPMDALEDNDIIATDMAILKQLNQLAPVIFTERTAKFKVIQQFVKILFTPLIGVSGQEFNEQIKNDILSYLTIAAFMHSGTPGDKGSLVNSLIYNNDENNIIGLVEKGRAMIAKSAVGKNYMLNNYIATVPTNGKGKTNEIRINSWTNVSEQVQEKIAASFVDLYTNAYTDAETGEEIDTRPIAAAMFNYLLVKDGGQFKSGSFVKYIANFIFGPLLDSAGELNVAIKSEEELEKLTGKSFKELTSGILQSIGTHINSEKRIPKIPTKGEGLPDGMQWSDDLSTITYTIPQNVIHEGRSYHAGFEINAKEVYAVFPLYLRSPDSKLFQLTRTGDNKSQQKFQFLENGQPMGRGITAEYKRINYTGAINTWAGGGVFGPVPVAPSQSNQVVTNNPGYETSANPINNTTIASGATVLPSITPEDTTAVTWREAITSQGLSISMVGDSYMLVNSKTGVIVGKLSDTPNGQGGFFTTPEQFGEAIIKRRGWTQKTDDGEVMFSEQPVVPLQSMEPTQQLSPEQWKAELTAIYKEKTPAVEEYQWLRDKLAYRNGRRNAGVSDATILEEIKAC